MSLYLDGVRLLAALLVFASHAAYPRLGGEWLSIFRLFGHDAVIVFFVLSGYVISYVSHNKEHSLTIYSISRLSRLYSVALPALIITIIVDLAGSSIDPGLYNGSHYESNMPIIRFIANLLFINEISFYSIRAFGNGAYWSLGYEFWYYVLFGLYFYINTKYKWWLLSLVAIICIPKILLLFPIWITGHLLYIYNQNNKISPLVGWILFLSPILFYFVYKYLDINTSLYQISESSIGSLINFEQTLMKSKYFLSDYVVTILIAINFIGFNAISNNIYTSIKKFEHIIKTGASYTFTIYLLHYPLLHFYYSFIKSNSLAIALTLITIIFVAKHTEHKKYIYKKIISKQIYYLKNKLSHLQ
jgi:peptidoglycan/LPS O-acetylase OafA/YrhL